MYKTMIIGNLGRDARRRVSESGVFLSFPVAVSLGDKTIWFDCTLDGEREKLLPYLVKGSKVFCLGSQASKIYQDGAGRYMISHNLRVNQLELCGGDKSEVSSQSPASPPIIDPESGEILSPSSRDSSEPF